MPESGVKMMDHKDIITYEEIVDVVKYCVNEGINKIRLTGGEPLVRKGIVDLVRMIADIKGVEDFGLTTNGILLKRYARQLKGAGLKRVNVSLDTLDPDRFREITRLGDVANVVTGIKEAKSVGLTPVKINCVVMNSSSEPDAVEVAKFCKDNDLEIRYIKQMQLNSGHFSVVDGGDGGNCSICNRLRLTADGKIKPCLFNNLEYSIREYGIKGAIDNALIHKPKCGSVNTIGEFYNIGG
jgi:cyclic pyranopterin phosphate synthase